jgi:hypothetical protein
VIWRDGPAASPQLRATRIDRDGRVAAPGGNLVAARGETPALTWVGDAFLAVWTLPGEERAMAGALLDDEGQPIAGRELAIAAGDSKPTDPELVWSGDRGLLVYRRMDVARVVLRLRARAITLVDAPALPPTPDAGAPPADARSSAADGGGADVALADTGVADVARVDRGPPDAVAVSGDAQTAGDGATVPMADAGGGATADAGTDPAVPSASTQTAGCSCALGARAKIDGHALPAALAALAGLVRLRRRVRSGGDSSPSGLTARRGRHRPR